MKKGSTLKVEKTLGLDAGSYDLYDLRGLSLGKLNAIKNALMLYNDNSYSPGASELLGTLRMLDNGQTINGK